MKAEHNVFADCVRICHDPKGEVNSYYEYRCVFTPDSDCAELYISADSQYAVYLNGTLKACGQYPGYEDMRFYDCLTLEGALPGRPNTLTIGVYYQGCDSSTYRSASAGVIFRLISGGVTLLRSAPGTEVRRDTRYASGVGVAQVSGQLGFTFDYNAAADPEPYIAAREATPVTVMLPRPVRRMTVSPPAETAEVWRGRCGTAPDPSRPAAEQMYSAPLNEGDGWAYIFDLGAETVGYPYIELTLSATAEVQYGWGEHLADGRVRTFVGSRCFAAGLRFGAGKSVFIHPFMRIGCRYIELHIIGGAPDEVRATLLPCEYVPRSPRRRFECDDALHKRIAEVCERTLLLCMHDHYEDCPWREQALYTMDSRNQMLCGYYAFGETDMPGASIRLIAHSLRPDGLFELCSPARVTVDIPSFTAIFFREVYEYYSYSSDKRTVCDIYCSLRTAAMTMISKIDPVTGLLPIYNDPGCWNFIEWSPGLDGYGRRDGYDGTLSCFAVYGLCALAELADAIGVGDAEEYRAAALRLTDGINRLLWDSERSVYAAYLDADGKRNVYAAVTSSVAAVAGVCPPDRLDPLLTAIASGEGLVPATLSSTVFRYDALMLRPETYARFVFEEIRRVWGAMLDAGATSFWEVAEGERAFGGAGSLCHGWSAVPLYIYLRYALELPYEVTGITGASARSVIGDILMPRGLAGGGDTVCGTS